MNQADLVRRFVEGLAGTGTGMIRRAGADDVGIVALDANTWLAATTDYVNFRPFLLTLNAGGLRELGYLLVANNVSDLLGSGAAPIGILSSIGIPASASEADVDELIAGVRAAVDELGIMVIGGDTKQAPAWSLCGTALGLIPAGCAWTQDGARVGHHVALSGAIGAVSAAVLHLSRSDGVDALTDDCRRALAHPTMPTEIARRLRALRFAGGGTDVSDGLGGNLHQLLDRSGVGVRVVADALPIHPLARVVAHHHRVNPVDLAFGLGGDGQFLVTMPPEHVADAVAAGVHVVGEIVASDKILASDNHEHPLPTFLYQDFRSEHPGADYLADLSRRLRESG